MKYIYFIYLLINFIYINLYLYYYYTHKRPLSLQMKVQTTMELYSEITVLWYGHSTFYFLYICIYMLL